MRVPIRDNYDANTLEGQVHPSELVPGVLLARNWVTGVTYGLFRDQGAANRAVNRFGSPEDSEVVYVSSSNVAEIRQQLAENFARWRELYSNREDR